MDIYQIATEYSNDIDPTDPRETPPFERDPETPPVEPSPELPPVEPPIPEIDPLPTPGGDPEIPAYM